MASQKNSTGYYLIDKEGAVLFALDPLPSSLLSWLWITITKLVKYGVLFAITAITVLSVGILTLILWLELQSILGILPAGLFR